jgi:ABC-type branched-subunit amino acid transport system ATPase component
MALLEVKGLRRRFGGVTALDGADLTVEQGRITGLIGPNGAGKTTLFNAVTGALRPNGGSVTFDGSDITGWRPDRLAKFGLSRTFQIARGLGALSVIENLMLYGKRQPGEAFTAAVLRTRAARGREAELRARAIEVARELNLLHVGDNRAIDLSGGQKKLLELGRALMAEPKLIMLDTGRRHQPDAGEETRRAYPRAQGPRHHVPDHRAQHGHGRGIVRSRRGSGAGPAPRRRPLRRIAGRSARAGHLHGASRMMLAVTNVVAGYGAHDEVLKGVGIAVKERELVVLIGPNGAGKSTLLKSIAGFLKPREGAIIFQDKPIGGLKPREITRRGIAFVPQEANVFPSLSVEANLEMGGYVDRRATKERMQAAFARFPVLAERRRQDARTLSGGQRQMLAMAMALMAAPRLMLLDEPSAGLSPAASQELFALIRTLHRDGMTIIMVEQNAIDALEIADRGYLLVDGSNARDGRASDLAADAEVRQAFLGA